MERGTGAGTKRKRHRFPTFVDLFTISFRKNSRWIFRGSFGHLFDESNDIKSLNLRKFHKKTRQRLVERTSRDRHFVLGEIMGTQVPPVGLTLLKQHLDIRSQRLVEQTPTWPPFTRLAVRLSRDSSVWNGYFDFGHFKHKRMLNIYTSCNRNRGKRKKAATFWQLNTFPTHTLSPKRPQTEEISKSKPRQYEFSFHFYETSSLKEPKNDQGTVVPTTPHKIVTIWPRELGRKAQFAWNWPTWFIDCHSFAFQSTAKQNWCQRCSY